MGNGYGDTPITVTVRSSYGSSEVRLRIGNRTFVLDRNLGENRAEALRNQIIDILNEGTFEVKSKVTVTADDDI
jgi:hypothetical protein